MPSNLHDLEIHVLNAGVSEGESIAIKLPNGLWGVVDCYARSLSNPQSNPTLRFLQDRNVNKIEFFCITHPHEDHYRGACQILNKFQVKIFWRYDGPTSDEIDYILAYFAHEAENGDEVLKENNKELFSIYETLNKLSSKRKNALQMEYIQSRKQLYPQEIDPESQIQIWSLAPSSKQVSCYRKKLFRCFDKEKNLKKKMQYFDHNIISAALVIKYGKTHVVLGGDVDETGWKHVLKNFQKNWLYSNMVKVSHHGSSNGYNAESWLLFSKGDEKPIAVVTPFGRFDLPSKEAIEHIKRYSQALLSPYYSEDFSDYSPDMVTRAFIHKHFDAKPMVKTNFGVSSIIFDDEGNCKYKGTEFFE